MQKLSFLKPALPLTVICVVIALLLAVVNAVTADKIEDNARKEKESAIEKIFPESESFESSDPSLWKETVSDAGSVRNGAGDVIGYFAEVSPVGFKGEISLIVGCDAEGKIIKVSCPATTETPAVGTKATDEKYLEGYTALTGDDVMGVDTITGATISSKAVRLGIHNAVLTAKNIIEEGE